VIKRIIGALGAVLVLAGCGTSHPASAHRLGWSQSYKVGIAFGKSAAWPNETDSQIHANCKKHMPSSDNKAAWMGGCFAGNVLGLMKLDQSNGS
jgi:hypothetical protein